jgi:hypothetical protein
MLMQEGCTRIRAERVERKGYWKEHSEYSQDVEETNRIIQ